MVEGLNITVARDVSCKKDAPTSFRSTKNSNEYDSLLITALKDPINNLGRQLAEKRGTEDALLARFHNWPYNYTILNSIQKVS